MSFKSCDRKATRGNSFLLPLSAKLEMQVNRQKMILKHTPHEKEPLINKCINTEFIKEGIYGEYEEQRIKLTESIGYCLEPKWDATTQEPMNNEATMKFIYQQVKKILFNQEEQRIDNICKGLFDHLRNRGIKLFNNYMRPELYNTPGNTNVNNSLSSSRISWKSLNLS